MTNCVAYNFGTDFGANASGTGSDYNASSDTSAPGANSVHSITSAAFVDSANDDYTPASGGALAGAGTDLSAFFSDDITGTAR